jgi:dipeptidase E
MAQLTGKPRPRLLYLPTASADRPDGIISWFQSCANLNVSAFVQPSFISSYRQMQSWEEVLLSMDGIVASGGNTLNQQAIWKAQGIDAVLKEAWDRGIVLGGASAGSLCWFEEGTTDSRPKELSVVKCLGFIKGSHSPHYDGESQRRPTYHRMIASGELKPGYACDNDAGIYFEDNTMSARSATGWWREHWSRRASPRSSITGHEHVQKHQDAGEFRAAGDGRRGSRIRAAVRPQAEWDDAAVARK